MAELKAKREETERARREAGVAEYEESDEEEPGPHPAGTGEGSGDPFAKIEAAAPPKITGRGIDKRKRELEERRRAIEAKRRKLNPGAAPRTHTSSLTLQRNLRLQTPHNLLLPRQKRNPRNRRRLTTSCKGWRLIFEANQVRRDETVLFCITLYVSIIFFVAILLSNMI